jgi:hypothetical protein
MVSTIIAGVVGITSTILAWKLNPRRRTYAELDSVYTQLEKLYKRRDKALAENNSDELTAVTVDIIRLRKKSHDLLQRLGCNLQ